MSNSYSSFCDDFYFDMYVNTELELPTQRDTILAFYERIQKQYPSMGNFYRRQEDNYYLEEDRTSGTYCWVGLELDRIGSGIVNPTNLELPCQQNKFVLELMPYMLSVSHLDIDSLDVTFAMDFEYSGNHDEVIAEALLGQSSFTNLLDSTHVQTIGFSPVMVLALTPDYYTQMRISVKSKTSIYEPGEKRPTTDESISLSFTIRQYPTPNQKFDPLKSFEIQYHMARDLMDEKIIPQFAQPLKNIISEKGLTFKEGFENGS